MVFQEDFDFSVATETAGSGTAYVTFFTKGAKCLLFYFEETEMTDIAGILIIVEQAIYSLLTFTTDLVKFI
jgi:hypothetical protein